MSNGDEYVEVRVGSGQNGGVLARNDGFQAIRSTKEHFTALGTEGMLYRLVRSTGTGTRIWEEYHFITTKNGFTFNVSTEVPKDQEILPAYFQDILSGWQWLAPETFLAVLGTPGELDSIHMISETQGWALARGRVLRTEDGGEHWAAVTLPGLLSNPWAIGSKFYDADHVWLAVQSDDPKSVVVFCSAYAGQTWEKSIVQTKNNILIYGLYLDFVDPAHGWLLLVPEHGMSSLPGELYRTTDGGERWSEVASSGGFGHSMENGLPFSGPFSFRDALTGWLPGQQGAGFTLQDRGRWPDLAAAGPSLALRPDGRETRR